MTRRLRTGAREDTGPAAQLLIRGGTVIDPARGVERALDVLIDGGVVRRIAPSLRPTRGTTVLEARGCVVCPGLIDIHTHLREPGYEEKETIASGTRAAAAGGVTSLLCMPNTNPPIDNQTAVEFVVLKARNEGVVNVFPVGAITKRRAGEELSEIGELHRAGVVAITDDGDPVMNSKIMRRALEYARMFDLVVMSHCEDVNLSRGGTMNEGRVSSLLGLRGIPRQAEEVMVIRDLILAELTGGRLHVTHVSTRDSVEYIRRAKKEGVRVTCDTAPHYFSLTEDAVRGDTAADMYNTNAKMNPPLRTGHDVAALVAGIADGTIDCVASDHAPHTREEKSREFDLAPFGIIGLETMLPLCVTVLHRRHGLPLRRVVEVLTAAPARAFGLPRGTLAPGLPADVTVFDPRCEFVVGPFVSRSQNSPFIGWKLFGKVIGTVCNGRIVYQGR